LITLTVERRIQDFNSTRRQPLGSRDDVYNVPTLTDSIQENIPDEATSLPSLPSSCDATSIADENAGNDSYFQRNLGFGADDEEWRDFRVSFNDVLPNSQTHLRMFMKKHKIDYNKSATEQDTNAKNCVINDVLLSK